MKLTFVPSGGLGNRMMSVASAYTLASRIGAELRILWFRDWALRAPFSSIFKPLCADNVTLCEQSLKHLLINDRPRKKNFFFPLLPEMIIYDSYLSENEIYKIGTGGVILRDGHQERTVG